MTDAEPTAALPTDVPLIDPTVIGWARSFTRVPDGDVLPAHSPQCVGCGPDNPHGLRMVVRRHGDGVRSDLIFDQRHVGAPGVAHGGTVAMAFDDLFGFLLYLVGDLAVTRNLTVDYLAPVRLGVAHTLTAHHHPRAGRRIPVTAELARTEDGAVMATATATFIVVDVHHFTRAAGLQ